MIANSGEIAPSRLRCAIAGASSRRVRSPEAPKMTSVHGRTDLLFRPPGNRDEDRVGRSGFAQATLIDLSLAAIA